jgi:hypothetical protein
LFAFRDELDLYGGAVFTHRHIGAVVLGEQGHSRFRFSFAALIDETLVISRSETRLRWVQEGSAVFSRA